LHRLGHRTPARSLLLRAAIHALISHLRQGQR
jgi:DNA-directed RNA polymerase specialized sigma24 family protein